MTLYAIGDIQGCAKSFDALLNKIGFSPARDRLWLVGDLVNRGPRSLRVLRMVRELGDAASCVLGNHDLHLLALAGGRRRRRREPQLEPILQAPDSEELLAWLAARPLLHRDAELGWTLVHAGLPPQWTLEDAEAAAREVEQALAEDRDGFMEHMYGDDPHTWSPSLSGYDRLRFAVNCLTRLRYVTRAGRMLLHLKGPPAGAPEGAIPWFRHPARATAGARIVFGHWSALGYLEEDGVLSLDTGCVWGGSLCAARIDLPAPTVAVDCRGSLQPGED